MVLSAYRWLFEKVLDWRVRRDIALFSDPIQAGDSKSVSVLNHRYIQRRVQDDMDDGVKETQQHKWLIRAINGAFAVNFLSLIYRILKPGFFKTDATEAALLVITLSSLLVVFWGVSTLHGRMNQILEDDFNPGEDRHAHHEAKTERERLNILVVNALCTCSVALIAIVLLPHAWALFSLVPVVVMTVVLAVQRMTHRIISEDLSPERLKEYLQLTQAYYASTVRDEIFFRQLEGSPISVGYLMSRQELPSEELSTTERYSD